MTEIIVLKKHHTAPPRRAADTGVVRVPGANDTIDRSPESDYATPAATPDIYPLPGRRPGAAPDEVDHRFRDLLGDAAWASLPLAVRRRFARRLSSGGKRIFHGTVTSTRLSRAGRLIARLARIVGSPLPDQDGATGPATVLVTESPGLGGQIWTRTYSRPGRFPQTINSVKRFSGPTGIEESLGYGLVMRLHLEVEQGALVFASSGYDLEVGGMRLSLPHWLTPGTCTITHRADGPERFTFTLRLEHPWLGLLALQVAEFVEART